ncbi:hypothetical protein WJX72_008358 [[Myrmecia] bisecta]|uniref:Alpha-amylase n=1 Tax=[Myrmecia] bisecta TaxID=41462 RepID=A0AAW1R8B2_9CHLO
MQLELRLKRALASPPQPLSEVLDQTFQGVVQPSAGPDEPLESVLSSMADAASSAGFDLILDFNNDADPEATVITIQGQDQSDLLMTLTGAFNSLDLAVISATIRTTDEGQVLDVFKVVDANDQKIAPDQFDIIRAQVLALCATSSRSSKPAIYGVAAAAEVQRLRPLSSSSSGALEGDAAALELAAAEMAQAAANLVQIERAIVELVATGSDPTQLNAIEAERTEAAALLERRMAAMQAVLAGRRAPAHEAQPASARGPGADLRFQAGGATSSGPAAGDGNEIILQGFNWESHRMNWYHTLKSQAGQIADAGFSSVWMPPPSDSVSQQGYLPRDLYTLDSCYGTEADLRDCISTLHENGLKAIADIVINHRCAHSQGDDGKWNKFGGRLAWDKSVICSNNFAFGGTGHAKTGEDYTAAPNIDHTQDRVRKDITQWMAWLRKNVGFDGWRFDFVKGYSGQFAREYIDATVPQLAFGEYWDTCEYTDGVLNYNQDAHRQRTISWCDSTGGTAAAFDFTTKGILQEAMGRGEYWRLSDSQGRPPGVVGMWPSRAITFIENHDTGSTLNHWPFPWNHLHEGYAYILTHPGTPCVFWDHLMADGLGQAIKTLMKIRRKHSIHCRSKVVINKAVADVYAATIDNRICVKVGYGNWSPHQENLDIGQKEWQLATSGPQFAVWEAVF